MTDKIKHLLAASAALVIVAAISPAEAVTARRDPTTGAIRYFDDRGNDRGFAWCLRLSARFNGGHADCRYFSYEQCRASIIGPPGGDCLPNPFSYYVQVPPGAPKQRRR